MKILIISGEISGDVYAANITAELRRQNDSLEIYGIGGDRLKETCQHFLFNIAHYHAIGISERFNYRKFYKKLFIKLDEFFKQTRIDKVVLIDFQHYNFRIAEIISRYNIPITTFITPNFWIWEDLKGIRKVVSYSKKIITLFKKEYEIYKGFYPSVYYFGHPILQLLKPALEKSSIKTDDKVVVSLFPGSRRQEINYLLPSMLEALKILYEQDNQKYLFYIKLSSKRFLPVIVKHLKEKKVGFIRIWDRGEEEIYSNTDVIISSAGSATLEAVLHNVPLIVLGALSPFSYFIAWYILKIRPEFISLPNIITASQVVPEFIQNKIDPVLISENVKSFLQPEIRNELLTKYKQVKEELYEMDNPLQQICETILD